MECPRCGADLVRPDSDHICQGIRPSTGWQIATWSLIVLAAGYGAIALAELGLTMAGSGVIDAARSTGEAAIRARYLAELRHLVAVARVTDTLFWVLLVCLIMALIVWNRVSAGVLHRCGIDDVRPLLRHWAGRVWSTALIASIGISIVTVGHTADTVDDVLYRLHVSEIRYVLRTIAAAFLVVSVVLVGRRIRRYVPEPTRPAVATGAQSPATGWRWRSD